MGHLLPLFPLNVAIVPGLVLPLHIFEPRYRGLIAELLDEPDPAAREFGIIAIREGRSLERDGMAALYEIGTATVLRRAEELDDGQYEIVTTGSRRFHLDSLDTSRPLARAEVTWLGDPAGNVGQGQVDAVGLAFSAYQDLLGGGLRGSLTEDDWESDEDEDEHLPDDPIVLSFLVTAAMVLPVDERQQLLAAPDAAQRLTLARVMLSREIGLISTFGALPALDLGLDQPSLN